MYRVGVKRSNSETGGPSEITVLVSENLFNFIRPYHKSFN